MRKISLTADVLVVGAGPVGMVLANILKRNGLQVVLIDKRAGRPECPRAIAINQSTLDVFAILGMTEVFKAGLKVEQINLFWKHKFLGKLSFEGSLFEAPYFFHIPQNEIEKYLENTLSAIDLEVQRECELINYSQNDQSVYSLIKTKDELFTIKSKFLIGCDGGQSKVRDIMACGVDQQYYGPTFVLADVLLDEFDHKNTNYIFTRNGYLMIVPLPRNQYRLIFSLLPTATDTKDDCLDLRSIQKLLEERSHQKIVIKELIWTTKAQYGHRISHAVYQDKVVLAGDSLHQFSPVGGTNMNVGIQDAYALAWRLIDETKDIHTHLQEYSFERREVIQKQKQITEWITSLITRSKQCVFKDKNKNLNDLLTILTGMRCGQKLAHLQSVIKYSDFKNYLSSIREAFASANYVLLTRGILSPVLQQKIKQMIVENQLITWVDNPTSHSFEFYFCRPDAMVIDSGNLEGIGNFLDSINIGVVNE
ncbi:FAD-dependent oxidoreductase [Legionella spiritensis]|uniref:FAD dependent oxidoreductase n=1 Tax=Legionella spiritensis TaxID=452 RepID=A0A0W0YZ74_LEGSP|nr:NAD(P)/FAD-dependent oxidoreductase [Legionella spiritensis]KTD62114.1 FAD dependent oxidoreductase [Legionella spiritensis]SNV34169.1 FAD dependent oxidoreductase [Legionella spiritensis]